MLIECIELASSFVCLQSIWRRGTAGLQVWGLDKEYLLGCSRPAWIDRHENAGPSSVHPSCQPPCRFSNHCKRIPRVKYNLEQVADLVWNVIIRIERVTIENVDKIWCNVNIPQKDKAKWKREAVHSAPKFGRFWIRHYGQLCPCNPTHGDIHLHMRNFGAGHQVTLFCRFSECAAKNCLK